jgi:hypothetical protein
MKNEPSRWKLLINAIYNCKQPFTKEELLIELDKLGLEVMDGKFDSLMSIVDYFVFKNDDGMYFVDISNIFKERYGIVNYKEEK